MFPYTDIVTRIVDSDPNAYGAIYVEQKSTQSHYTKEVEENPEEGKLNVKSVMINRNAAFDELMYLFKQKVMVIHNVDEEFVSHLRDMKRIQKFTKSQEMRYVWEKTEGKDHYHHALLYFYIATKLRGTAGAWSTPGVVPFLSSFRVKSA
jgi:hypothetical protein